MTHTERHEAKWRSSARTLAHWIIPPGFQDVIRRCLLRSLDPDMPESYRAILDRNGRFRNKHAGERCFVLATGPSIREQDLRPLANEWCIAVSEFYRHQHYREIKPAYYAFAPNHPPFTDDDFLRELAEMKERSQDEVFFFGITDKPVVDRSNLVTDWERVCFLHFLYDNYRPERVELTASLPGPCSAAVVGVWVAIYMGFSEIYLVGCDHDVLWKWDGIAPFSTDKHYQHFYDDAPGCGFDSTDVDGLLRNALEVREIYRWSSRLALKQGTKILNANPRSRLDVVPRVSLADLFQGRSPTPRIDGA